MRHCYYAGWIFQALPIITAGAVFYAFYSLAKMSAQDLTKGGFKSEDTGKILRLKHKYSKSLSWAENLNKLFTVLGRKLKFSAQDSDFEYLCWRCKNYPVSSDLKPPLA